MLSQRPKTIAFISPILYKNKNENVHRYAVKGEKVKLLES